MDKTAPIVSFEQAHERTDSLPAGSFPDFCTLVLSGAKTTLLKFDSVHILIQTISHYLVCAELFECNLSEATTLSLNVKTASFFMLVMGKGDSVLTDAAGNVISETKGNCSTIMQLNAGNYRRTLTAGKHKMLVLTFKTGWFMDRVLGIDGFKPLLSSFILKDPYSVLPHCAIAQSIFNAAEKLQLHPGNQIQGDLKILSFVDACLTGYLEKLIHKQYDANTVSKQIQQEIKAFVKEHFREDLTGNTAAIARQFNLSERSFFRQAKLAFGKPFHKQVMEYKLLYGLKALMMNKVPIRQVALEMGYKDQYYFSRAFKKHYGVTPTEIRHVFLHQVIVGP